MTVKEAIDTACAIKPNAFPRGALIGRLNECEGQVLTDVFDIMPGAVRQYRENTETDPTAEDEVLTVPHPFCKIYVTYLTAMLDFDNGEYDKYQNTMTLFNHQAEDFAKWYIRTHERVTDGIFHNYVRLYDYADTDMTKKEWIAERKNIRHIGIYTLDDWDKIRVTENFRAELIIADNLVGNMPAAMFVAKRPGEVPGDIKDAKNSEEINDLKRWVMCSFYAGIQQEGFTIDDNGSGATESNIGEITTYDIYRQIFITDTGAVLEREIMTADGHTWETVKVLQRID